MKAINIVWLKRDLRTQDHAPFNAAEKEGLPYYPIYIFEPSLLAHPDASLRHQQFVYHSSLVLNDELLKYKRRVELLFGEAEEIFRYIASKFVIRKVFSYQETGVELTWKRDKKVNALFQEKRIVWKQFQRPYPCQTLQSLRFHL